MVSFNFIFVPSRYSWLSAKRRCLVSPSSHTHPGPSPVGWPSSSLKVYARKCYAIVVLLVPTTRYFYGEVIRMISAEGTIVQTIKNYNVSDDYLSTSWIRLAIWSPTSESAGRAQHMAYECMLMTTLDVIMSQWSMHGVMDTCMHSYRIDKTSSFIVNFGAIRAASCVF